jgi:alanine-synthesizing transaminase
MQRHKIKPASRTSGIHYAIRDIILVAARAARAGKKLIYLNIGDPCKYDFRTPPHIVEATHRAMLDNLTGYSPSSGISRALEAIGRQAGRQGIGNIQDIFITSGASEGIDICLTALVEPGENVLVPSPGYPLYSNILQKIGARENPYSLDERSNWQPHLPDIAKKINKKTRAVVVINPNNPTGTVYDRETLRGMVQLAAKNNLVVIADEIYDRLILDEKPHVSIASLDKNVPVITFNGLSKGFLAPGFRIGWGILSGPRETVRDYQDAINKLLRARLCANHPEQHAIAVALNGDLGFLAEAKAKLRERRNITYQMLNDIPGISCQKPDGAFYAFPRLDIRGPDDRFVKELVRATGVVAVPGSGFGQEPGSRHMRIVFLPPEEILEKAYRLIKKFMAGYKDKA